MTRARSPRRPLVARVGVVLLVVAVLGILVWPEPIGAGRAPVVAQVVALRGLLALVLAAGTVAVIVAAARSSRRRCALNALAAVLLVATAVDAAVIGARGTAPVEALPAASDDVRVLSWNTEHGAPGAEAIAVFVVEQAADIVVLPETDRSDATRIASRIEASGRQVFADTIEQDFPGSTPTSVLVVGDLIAAEYRHSTAAGSTPGQPSGLWTPADPSAPIIGAVHTVPPMPWAMPLWWSGLDWVAERCVDDRAVIAGDLNATVDHFSGLGVDGGVLGRCRDAALELSAASRGTWPSAVPELLASPIDHVLIGSAWEVAAFDVLDPVAAAGSDHRPILAVLRSATP